MLLAFLLFTATGCVSGTNPFPTDRAIINDVAVRSQLDSGYRVTQVDGQAADRAQSKLVTVVPFVLVKPGERRLGLQPRTGEDLSPIEVTATFDAGKRYRLKRDGDVVTVVEDTE